MRIDVGTRWRPAWLLRRNVLGILLVAGIVAACSGGVEKADRFEALADTLIANKAYPAAVQALNSATSLDGNEPRRWLKLARTWRELGNPALAGVAFQRALDLDPANIEALQNLAVLSVQAGRYIDAKQFVEPLLVLAPNDVAGMLAQGAIAFYEKRYGDADALATQIIAAAPDFSEGYILRARIMDARGDTRGAAELLNRRLALDNGNAVLAAQLLTLYRSSGDLGGIRRTAMLLSKLKPDDITYQLEAARVYHAEGREDEARRIHAALLAKYPASPGMNDAVSDYWLATLPKDEAADRIVAMADRVSGRAKAVLARKLIALGRADTVAKLLAPDAATMIEADNVEVQSVQAAALYTLGRWDEAGAQAAKVLAFDRNDTASLVQAKLAFRRRDYADALNIAQLVRSNDGDNEEAALLIPKVYEAAGNLVLARKAYGDAVASMPGNLNVVRAYVAWLVDHKLPDDAAQVAAQFARANPRSGEGQQFARTTCAELKTHDCELAANNTRHPWNL